MWKNIFSWILFLLLRGCEADETSDNSSKIVDPLLACSSSKEETLCWPKCCLVNQVSILTCLMKTVPKKLDCFAMAVNH